ncbi:hypothetical protein TRFO_39038 [Tritrichomonas foetus]|uniref:non-specific serine/threonine protein kinase n=1 Tax=Tritrichomonas foetus TaxID=1144522 RepID=A0A1J4J958_9EUKA|nr:hypothetical protein TRFO_39038 [Tritrichomonas foetus]|eukprot:OHS94783.1 hypothetical protein TRFO_39038 [Tritrichomonas foetus]
MEGQIAGPYTILNRIGSGSFGTIYLCEHNETHKQYAAKVESVSTKIPQLSFESRLYKLIAGGNNIAKTHWQGVVNNNNVVVMDLLGKSLENLHEEKKKFSLKTVLMLIEQMIKCVEYLHRKHFIHRDIKPDNFVIGQGGDTSKIYIIDFGLAKRYRDPLTLKHVKYSDRKQLTGTARYASVNALRGIEQSRRDDMEALGYVWMYFLRGDLPWMGIRANVPQKKYSMICDCKMATSFEVLCEGFPQQFITYFKNIRALRFTEEPDYANYRLMFRELLLHYNFVYDGIFDWSISKAKRKPSLPPIPHSPTQATNPNFLTSSNPNMMQNSPSRLDLMRAKKPIFRSQSSLLSGNLNSVKVNAYDSSIEYMDSDSFTKQCADLKHLFDISDSSSTNESANLGNNSNNKDSNKDLDKDSDKDLDKDSDKDLDKDSDNESTNDYLISDASSLNDILNDRKRDKKSKSSKLSSLSGQLSNFSDSDTDSSNYFDTKPKIGQNQIQETKQLENQESKINVSLNMNTSVNINKKVNININANMNGNMAVNKSNLNNQEKVPPLSSFITGMKLKDSSKKKAFENSQSSRPKSQNTTSQKYKMTNSSSTKTFSSFSKGKISKLSPRSRNSGDDEKAKNEKNAKNALKELNKIMNDLNSSDDFSFFGASTVTDYTIAESTETNDDSSDTDDAGSSEFLAIFAKVQRGEKFSSDEEGEPTISPRFESPPPFPVEDVTHENQLELNIEEAEDLVPVRRKKIEGLPPRPISLFHPKKPIKPIFETK